MEFASTHWNYTRHSFANCSNWPDDNSKGFLVIFLIFVDLLTQDLSESGLLIEWKIIVVLQQLWHLVMFHLVRIGLSNIHLTVILEFRTRSSVWSRRAMPINIVAYFKYWFLSAYTVVTLSPRYEKIIYLNINASVLLLTQLVSLLAGPVLFLWWTEKESRSWAVRFICWKM